MIVAMILNGPWLSEQPGSAFVVNNPPSFTKSYCLPLMVVNFGIEKQLPGLKEIQEAKP